MKEKEFMLNLAKDAITDNLDGKTTEAKDIPEELKENRGVFITLTKHGELRGCIGYIEPIKPAYQAIIECAVSAAFNDPRFPPVEKDELKDIKIEISLLTRPQPLEFKDSSDLLDKLSNNLGVILKKGPYQSTFLPQVWEQIPKKEDFLSQLCLKAGIDQDAWKEDIEVETYKVEKFS